MSERWLRPAAALLAALAFGVVPGLPGEARAQSWRTINSARQVWDRSPLEVRVQYSAGELRLEPASGPMLYRLEMRYDEEHFTPVTAFDADARKLTLGVEARDRRRNLNLKEGSRAAIALSREVPMDLNLSFGAGEAQIDLGGMALRNVHISTGASETTVRFDRPNRLDAEQVRIESGAAELEVFGLGNTRAERFQFQGGVGSTLLDFSGAWSRDATADVQLGLGTVKLRFPRGLGVRLTRSSFLTSFDGEGLVRQGDSFYSPDWERARHRLTLEVSAAFGSIEVEWIGQADSNEGGI